MVASGLGLRGRRRGPLAGTLHLIPLVSRV